MTLITVNIIPEVDIINLFDEEYTTPTQTFTLNGVVEVTTERPVHIRQVNLQFKGRVKSLVSFSDFIQESTQLNTNYEIPLKRWNTLEYDDTSVLQWVSRKALGYSHAYIDLIRQRETILDETVLLSTGKNVFPFSLEICNADRLPPSVILPQHKILYQLSAKIKLASFSEKFKVHYWSARSQRHTQELPPSPPLAPYEQDDFDPIDPSIMDSVELGDRDILLSQLSRSSKQENLGCSRLVQVCRHSYPSLLLLGSLHRVRYRGVRQRCLKYQVSMPRFACLQLPVFKFDCKFETLAHDANIKKVMYFIEQSEIYPLRAGDFKGMVNHLGDMLIPRIRKYSLTEKEIENHENGEPIGLSVSLNLPHISQDLDAKTLIIKHKLRLYIYFTESAKHRTMSLSFPLHIGTVPKAGTSSLNPDLSYPSFDLVEDGNSSEDELHKLPSYQEAMHEGAPPSPFLEDHI